MQIMGELMGMMKNVEGMMKVIRGEEKEKKSEMKIHEVEWSRKRKMEELAIVWKKRMGNMDGERGREREEEEELTSERADRMEVISDRIEAWMEKGMRVMEEALGGGGQRGSWRWTEGI